MLLGVFRIYSAEETTIFIKLCGRNFFQICFKLLIHFTCFIQVWNVSSGFSFVTFSEHTNAVTALHFMGNNHCLLSASLDGTVRAWDLFRYRNFRTFTTSSPRQFVSLAADQSGEVICAGTLDSFEVLFSLLVVLKYRGIIFAFTNFFLCYW